MAQLSFGGRMIVAIVLAFLLSFCSFGYQQLFALALFDGTGNFVAAQAGTIAVFLLGLGVGSLRAGSGTASWPRLIRLEWCLSALGAFSIFYVNGAEILMRMILGTHSLPGYIALTSPYIFLIGFLTGYELPLLLRLYPHLRPGTVLAAHYLGALGAAVVVPTWLFTQLDLLASALALGLLNFVAATILVLNARSTLRLALHCALAALLFLLTQISPKFSSWHLKGVYFTPTVSAPARLLDALPVFSALDTPIRLRTKYQWIDILPPEFSEAIQGRQDFQLYLDRRLQLSSGALARYHQSFAHGAVNLSARDPERVLILGGGDGLLIKELLTYSSIRSIDLVELDSEMIRLARSQPELRRYNGGSFEDPRVTVHIGDAFRFVVSSPTTYNLILIDLPFPVNYELSLLFSKEFYARVRERLGEGGVMAFDFPLPGGNNRDLPVLIKTLHAAGWTAPFAYGVEDFFIAAHRDNRPLQFQIEQLGPRVDNQTLRNLITRTRELEELPLESARINSVLFPYRFQAGLDERIQTDPLKADHVIRAQENPGFLPLYLNRFQSSWKRLTGFEPPDWPIAEFPERDFSEPVTPGQMWPRFQWGLNVVGDLVQPIYQWTDGLFPEQLRSKWQMRYGIVEASPWFSVAWTPGLDLIEFYFERDGQIFVGVHRKGKRRKELLLADYFTASPVGLIPPDLKNSQATRLQNQIQKDFLTYPRTHIVGRGGQWERIYFP